MPIRLNCNKQITFLVFVLVFGFFAFTIQAQEKVSLYLSPSGGSYFVGSTFDVSIFVNTGKEDINAVEVDLKFDPTKIQVASPTSGKSFIEVWVAQPSFSNTKGTASFIGGVPTPGVNTSSGLVSTVTFRAIEPGETIITFLDSSKVLRNDPAGTDILTSKGRGVYNLVIPPPEGPKVFSKTHPDQNKWYENNNPTFSWEKEEGTTDFSYSINQNPLSSPDNIREGEYTSISYSDVKDGIWYFHIKAKKNNIWGGITHYVVKIDSTEPAIFTPTIEPSQKTIEKQPLVSFITTDALSGLAYYQLKYIDVSPGRGEQEAEFFIEVTSPHKLPPLQIGEYLVLIRAYDLADNWRESTVKIEILPDGWYFSVQGIHYRELLIPWWLLGLLLLIILALIIYFYWRRHRDSAHYSRQEVVKMETKFTKTQQEAKNTLKKLQAAEGQEHNKPQAGV